MVSVEVERTRCSAYFMLHIHFAIIFFVFIYVKYEHVQNSCNFLLRKWSSSMMNVFPEFLPLNMLTVLPNSNNQVVIPLTPADQHRHHHHHHQQQHHLEEGGINYRQLEGTVRALNCCFGIRCSSMEVKIVKYAKHVLDIKDRDLKEQKEREQMQQRIVNIEQRMEEMLAEVVRQGAAAAEAADAGRTNDDDDDDDDQGDETAN